MGLLELPVPVAEQQVQWGHCITGAGLSRCTGTGGGGSRAVEETMEISTCAGLLSLFTQSLAHVPVYRFWRTWSSFWLTGEISWVLSMHVD